MIVPRALTRFGLLLMVGWAPQVASLKKNPIRKVINLLQQMAIKVEEEEKAETEMYDKFMCYCDTGKAELGKAVKDAQTKIPQLESSIDETSSAIARLNYDLKKHKKDRNQGTAAAKEGAAIRSKELATFTKESTEYKANIAALTKAIKAVEKGMAGSSLLQTDASDFQRLRHLAIDGLIDDSQRDVLVSFLSQGSSDSEGDGVDISDESSYTPAYQARSGEVSGALRELKEGLTKSLATATAQETKASQDFKAMQAARQKEIAALTRAIEFKTQQVGDLVVKLAEMKQDYTETSKSLKINSKFLADLLKGCDAKRTEWILRQKLRNEEKSAIADTIKILNDDDARELFKKTLPGPTLLLQIQVSAADVRDEALRILDGARLAGGGEPLQLDLLALAIRGKKVGFEKVLKMIDGMVVLLKKEQVTDDLHKTYCETTLETTEQGLTVAKQAVNDRQKAIDKQSTAAKVLAGEIEALIKGIKDLDKQVQVATQQRKSENAEFSAKRATNSAAKELLELAKKRLAEFYAQKSKAKALLAQTSSSDNFEQAMSFLQLEEEDEDEEQEEQEEQDKPGYATFGKGGTTPPPPESFEGYKKKDGMKKGVVGLMDMLIYDVSQQLAEMEKQEKKAQMDYEKFMKDSEKKRREDAKRISKKEGVKASLEQEIIQLGMKKASEVKLRDATAKFLANLHGECDWELKNYQKRKVRRNGEIESLQKAKAVLNQDSTDWMAQNRPGQLTADLKAKAAATGQTYITRKSSTFLQIGLREQRLALRSETL